MDAKREFLMRQLFGDEHSEPAVSEADLQDFARAQEKAARINAILEDQERSAAILRSMMHST